jgi:hypothetical protein
MEHSPFQPCDHGIVGRLGSDGRPTPVCLSLHRDYRCRHRGACCTAGWAIPVEPSIYETLRVHFGPEAGLFDSHGPRPDDAAALLGRRRTGECVFFGSQGFKVPSAKVPSSNPGTPEPRNLEPRDLCAVHRELGAERLPSACRQFPRVALHDARGIRISLSHYCPTAAELLLTNALASGAPVEIVCAPPPLSLAGAVEGLDARDALPPLLRPGMLMDLDAYDRWERRAIGMLTGDDLDAARAIEGVATATRGIQSWRPGDAVLSTVVEHEFDVARASEANEDLDADEARVSVVLASVPADVGRPARVDGFPREWRDAAKWWPDTDRVVRRYLAARLFGNWVAYQGTGLHAIVEYLRVCLSVLKMEAVRQHADRSTASSESSPWQIVKEAIRNADLLLVHLSDPADLSRRLS